MTRRLIGVVIGFAGMSLMPDGPWWRMSGAFFLIGIAYELCVTDGEETR